MFDYSNEMISDNAIMQETTQRLVSADFKKKHNRRSVLVLFLFVIKNHFEAALSP